MVRFTAQVSDQGTVGLGSQYRYQSGGQWIFVHLFILEHKWGEIESTSLYLYHSYFIEGKQAVTVFLFVHRNFTKSAASSQQYWTSETLRLRRTLPSCTFKMPASLATLSWLKMVCVCIEELALTIQSLYTWLPQWLGSCRWAQASWRRQSRPPLWSLKVKRQTKYNLKLQQFRIL